MNLLSSDDLSKDSINEIFKIADQLNSGKQELGIKEHATMALIFQKPSTRTRLSFEVAMIQLGGNAIYLDMSTTQFSRGETFADTAKILGSYCDFIAARLFRQSDLEEIANNSKVPVINALTDTEHPTQALADVYTIRTYKKNLKGTKLVFVGDIASNTANSLMLTAAKFGMDVFLLGPKGYTPNSKFVTKAREYAKVVITSDIADALDDADVIYTDTFVSMGQEADADKRKKLFAPYQVNNKMLELANKDAIVMHCLPAHRGEEITGEVLDGKQSVAWEQAKNKLLLNKALIIYLSKKT